MSLPRLFAARTRDSRRRMLKSVARFIVLRYL